ncbi:type II toxin-antitoxin system HipA family toxin [Raoultibacter phocaeensis]|uniref:type II toxin-antitoxin system HipA family toxin n=1 Tax=Raoultibacter phocaeensis TaxID=2479841 RepID=UPI001C59A522|nr:type II toxin-antitoxin system HipA family toxin [Raoultibacter phocaeensis]
MAKAVDQSRFNNASGDGSPARRHAPEGLSGSDLAIASLRVIMHGRLVGTLAQTEDGVVAFQYASSWVEEGFSLSPLSLPLESKVFVAKPHPLGGLFGVFDDSLPDGWGRLLVDRTLRERGLDPYSIGSLARLAIVGKSGMGALEYEPEVSLAPSSALRDLDEIAAACAEMLATDYSEDIDALFALGGSSGGARPKILTTIDSEDWIVKFPSSFDHDRIGAEEYALACAAKACGIEMPEVRLLPSKVRSGYFAIKRFDRVCTSQGGVRKVHMASVGALLETSHRTPKLDYDVLMRLTLRLTDDMEEVERLYRLMAFNVLIGNRDDHAKNFTFLHEDSLDAWTLSPAYDLTRNPGMNGEHATTVNGKGKGISRADLIEVGLRAGLPSRIVRSATEEVEEAAREVLRELG